MMRKTILKLNKQTKRSFIMDSHHYVNTKGTSYGLLEINKDGTKSEVIPSVHTKRSLHNHIQGYLKISSLTLNTEVA